MQSTRGGGPSPEIVTLKQGRRLLLEGCALAAAPRKATKTSVLGTIHHLGFVQIDSINSVERAHHLIMHARLDGYDGAMLTHHAQVSRRAFEHWTHDASVIRSEWLPWWKCRFDSSAARLQEDSWLRRRLGRSWKATIAQVLDAVRERGPLSTRDFPKPPRAGQGWWDWSPHKAALEYLWRVGELAISSRKGFEKIYDLAERVYGETGETPSRPALVEWAAQEALERLGAATPKEIAHFMHAITLKEANDWCTAAAVEGRVHRVLLERSGAGDNAVKQLPGIARADFDRAAARVRIDTTPRLLAPFDPLIRDRARLSGLFNFDYRFEAFVPAAKRVHGYYTMPVLVGDALIARVDLSSERDAGVLRISRTWMEPKHETKLAREQAAEACERLASQLRLTVAHGTKAASRPRSSVRAKTAKS